MSSDDRTDLGAPVADAGETNEGRLALFGSSVGANATFISSTYTSLLMFMGLVGGEQPSEVIVPFVEMRFDGPEGDDSSGSTPLFSQVLPLDNAAYVLEDISSDLVLVCRQFRSVSSGGTGPEMQRLEATKHFLTDAKHNIESCLTELDAIQRPAA